MQTITLEECVDIGWKFITDEEYNSDVSELTSIGLSVKKVYDDLINYYAFYQIAFETPQRFGFEFRRVWDMEFEKFKQMCNMYSKVDTDNPIKDYTHNYTSSGDNTNDFSDTPNQPMYADGNETIAKYLTNRTKNKSKISSEDTRQNNTYEAYERISKYAHNVEYDFINKFDKLFSKYIPIKNIPYPQCGIPNILAWRLYK